MKIILNANGDLADKAAKRVVFYKEIAENYSNIVAKDMLDQAKMGWLKKFFVGDSLDCWDQAMMIYRYKDSVRKWESIRLAFLDVNVNSVQLDKEDYRELMDNV